MRIDLSDLDRLEGIAEALERLFWCLMVLGFFTAILGSAGTGLLVLILGASAFVGRAGLEDFVRSRREAPESREEDKTQSKGAASAGQEAEPEITIYRAPRRRRTKSAV
ncbi:MAG TPA: hypothetical protein VGI17_03790 [Solirubrobacterales bacterium]